MEKDSDQSLLRVGREMEGQGMLPTFQLCWELSMSQGSGPLVWYRPGKKRQEQLTHILDTRSTTRQIQAEASWQGWLNNILKTDEKEESRARLAGKKKSERGRLEANRTWRVQCRQDSLLVYFVPPPFSQREMAEDCMGRDPSRTQMVSSEATCNPESAPQGYGSSLRRSLAAKGQSLDMDKRIDTQESWVWLSEYGRSLVTRPALQQ